MNTFKSSELEAKTFYLWLDLHSSKKHTKFTKHLKVPEEVVRYQEKALTVTEEAQHMSSCTGAGSMLSNAHAVF